MRRFLVLLLFLLPGCSDEGKDGASDMEVGEAIVVQPQFDMILDGKVHKYSKENLGQVCEGEEIFCIIDMMQKCTIDSDSDICDKKMMPRFVFMKDEGLRRPNNIELEILKVKPIDANSIEVFTRQTCDGIWFGLCAGEIIYVLDNKNGFWRAADVYAINQ